MTTDLGATGSDGVQDQSTSRTKDLLNRAQAALSDVVSQPGGAGGGGASPIVDSVESEIQRLREETLSPLREDLDELRQQQRTLSAEVAQLEQQRQYYQSLAQQQSNQAQIVDDLVQPLRDRLESAVTEQVNKALADYRQGGGTAVNPGDVGGDQDQSNAVLEQLQDTLQTVFSGLQTNTQRYESTLQSSMARIQTLGEQSEAILEHWLGRLNTASGVGAATVTPYAGVSRDSVGGSAGLSDLSSSEQSAANLSETDPALSGVPYPGMEFPAVEVAEDVEESSAAEEMFSRSAVSLPTNGSEAAIATNDFDDGFAEDGNNPFALGDWDLMDLSSAPPAITAPTDSSEESVGDGDIDFVDLEDVGLPEDQDGSEILDDVFDEADATSAADAEGLGMDQGADAEMPLVGLDLEGSADSTDEDEDEDATVIQYVNVDMLSQRREETFQMPDVLVNLSDDEGPRLAEDLSASEASQELEWQDEEDESAAQYLDDDLSSLQDPEGAGEASVELEEDDGGSIAGAGIAMAAGAAAVGFVAGAGDDGDDDDLFPVTPEAESPELAVVEETSGLDSDPAAMDLALDEGLADIDVTADLEGVEDIAADLEGDRDELLMEEMLGVGAAEDQVDEVIASESEAALELLDAEVDEAAELAAVIPGASETPEDEEISLDDAVEDLMADEGSAESSGELEMMEGLPDVGAFLEEPATRSLDNAQGEGLGESFEEELGASDEELGASDLDQLGIGTDDNDPLAGLEELSGDDEAADDDASRGLDLGAVPVAGAAIAAGFAAFGGGDDAIAEEATADDVDLDDLGLDDDLALNTDLDTDAVAEMSLEDTASVTDLEPSLDGELADLGLDGDVSAMDEVLAGDSDMALEDEAVDLGIDEDLEIDLETDLGSDLDVGELGESIDSDDDSGSDLADLGLGDGLDIDGLDTSEAGTGDELVVGNAADDDLGLDFGDESVGAEASESSDTGLEADLGLELETDSGDDLGEDLGLDLEESLSLESETDASDELAELGLPETLPESADDEVSDLLDDAVEAADALDLPGLEGDGDATLEEGMAELDLDGLSGDLDLDAEAAAGTGDIDLELGGDEGANEVVAELDLDGLSGDLDLDSSAETTTDTDGIDDLGLELDGAAGEEGVSVDLDLEAVLGDEAADDGLNGLGADLEGTSDDLDLDLDGLGEGEPAAETESVELDLDDLGLDAGVPEMTTDADDGLDLDLAGLGDDSDAGGDLDFDLESLDAAVTDTASDGDAGDLNLALDGLDSADVELQEVLAGEAEAEAIASLDEALDLSDLSGDVTAVSTDVTSADVTGADDEDFDLDLLDSLAEFSEEESPMAGVDADLDAFLEDALGPDADGVEKKKE
ncbi:MAG: hypothetical protein AAF889_00260 [Cyanobacteria bacterium P01_D01_bin.73]